MNVFGGNPVWRSFRWQIRRGGRMLSGLLIGLVRCYQWTISPLLGPCCRFTPSCSHYFIGSVRKHGPFIGTLRGLWRICRCHPWSAGGHDPP